MRRVVVTGLGLVTPLGSDVETTWANILAGKSGIFLQMLGIPSIKVVCGGRMRAERRFADRPRDRLDALERLATEHALGELDVELVLERQHQAFMESLRTAVERVPEGKSDRLLAVFDWP